MKISLSVGDEAAAGNKAPADTAKGLDVPAAMNNFRNMLDAAPDEILQHIFTKGAEAIAQEKMAAAGSDGYEGYRHIDVNTSEGRLRLNKAINDWYRDHPEDPLPAELEEMQKKINPTNPRPSIKQG